MEKVSRASNYGVPIPKWLGQVIDFYIKKVRKYLRTLPFYQARFVAHNQVTVTAK